MASDPSVRASADVVQPRLIKATWATDVQYHEYSCVACAKLSRNTYSEPHRTQMLDLRLCFTCNYWVDYKKKLESKHKSMTIIGGHIYGPGNRTSGEFRGMGGRRFDIEYIEPSVYAGQRITTFDLWAGSAMPDDLKARFPDTAQFLDGAQKAQVGETTCWNQSETRAEPYPLPISFRALRSQSNV